MKLFIWDFHGVLEKGNDEIVFKITNRALKMHGHSRQMTRQEGEFLSGRLWRDYFAYLIPELDEDERLVLPYTDLTSNQFIDGMRKIFELEPFIKNHSITFRRSIAIY